MRASGRAWLLTKPEHNWTLGSPEPYLQVDSSQTSPLGHSLKQKDQQNCVQTLLDLFWNPCNSFYFMNLFCCVLKLVLWSHSYMEPSQIINPCHVNRMLQLLIPLFALFPLRLHVFLWALLFMCFSFYYLFYFCIISLANRQLLAIAAGCRRYKQINNEIYH